MTERMSHGAAGLILTLLSIIAAACTSTTATSATPIPVPTTAPTTTPPAPPAPSTSLAPGSEALAGIDGHLAVLGLDDEIVVVDPDGSDRVVLADADVEIDRRSAPTWSPDGTTVAWSERSTSGRVELVTATAFGEELTRLEIPLMAEYMAWSPQGSHVAIIGNDADGTLAIAVARPGSAISVIETGAPAYFDWAPDGSGLLIHVEDRFAFVEPDGTRTAIETRGDFRVGAFIGSGLLYGVDAGVGEAMVLSVAPGQPPVGIMRYAAPAAWVIHPDGDRVAVLARGSGESQSVLDLDDPELATLAPSRLEIVDLVSRDFETVFEGPAVAWFWSPDGSQLLYSESVVDAGAARIRWSIYRDGESMAFTPFTPFGEYARMYLAFFDQYARGVTFWSPDSKAFTYAGGTAERSGIWVQRTDGGEPVRIAEGQVAVWSPTGRPQAIQRPPLTVTTWPVMYPDSSAARVNIQWTMSSTSP